MERAGRDQVDLRRAVEAGFAASAAYLVANELDIHICRSPQRDLMLQGRLLPILRPIWPLAGLVLHAGFGFTLALLYAVVRDRLPGPAWLRGALWANLENAILWPLTPLIDRYHPAVQDGTMPRLATWTALAQAIWRHLVFGVVLGLADEALGRRAARR